MSNQVSTTRVVTEEVRFSYVSLLKPRESQYGGEPKFSVTILLPKSDFATKQRIDVAIETAKQLGKSKWNGVIPPVVAIPVHDGDGVKPSDGMPFGEECKGHWVFTASTSLDYPPAIVDAQMNPIINPTEVYSGMYGKIAVNFSPYASQGKKGIGCYISRNVLKTRDGEPLGSSAPAAADDFASLVGAAPQTWGGQPQAMGYGQQPPVPPQMPYGQPAQPYTQQAPYAQQPTAPNYSQQPIGYGQVPQQYDPITGQPISAVYGI